MYKNEFDNLLRQNKTFSAYMFYGQSHFLVEHYALTVAEKLVPSEDIEKIYYDEYDFKYCKNKLLQSSLFASRNVLIIKVEKKLPKAEVVELIQACNTNPDSTVIFACLGDADFKTMESNFSAKTNSVCVRMFAPFDSEAMRIIEDEAKKIGLKYEVSALSHLYFMHRNDLSLTINDLKKLAISDEVVCAKVVEQQCFGFGAVSLEDFLHNLVSGQKIERDLYAILEEGMNEIYLLTQITAFVQQLFMISAYARTVGIPNAKEILGFVPPKNVWEKKSKLAISIKPQKFQEMLEFLNNLELELKTVKINDQNIYIQACLRKFSVLFR
ncbi:MAG: DNA polymerase III subunit delta [Candidatus Marinarcus sp.]|uniref:DNA polymerase III subunit delta n=1 Tax=Candidatus Marinarcus sp. TaxID=3100987 RepID=UPI003B00C31C